MQCNRPKQDNLKRDNHKPCTNTHHQLLPLSVKGFMPERTTHPCILQQLLCLYKSYIQLVIQVSKFSSLNVLPASSLLSAYHPPHTSNNKKLSHFVLTNFKEITIQSFLLPYVSHVLVESRIFWTAICKAEAYVNCSQVAMYVCTL